MQNNGIDCPSHLNYPVVVGRYQEVITVPELVYVGKEGAESTAKGAAARQDVDVAGMVPRKESLLDPVKGWWRKDSNTDKKWDYVYKHNLLEEMSSGEPQHYTSDLSYVTGKAAKARQKAIEVIIKEEIFYKIIKYYDEMRGWN